MQRPLEPPSEDFPDPIGCKPVSRPLRHKIDTFQQTYFVIDSFQELFDKTAPDFTPVYERIGALPDIAADAGAETAARA